MLGFDWRVFAGITGVGVEGKGSGRCGGAGWENGVKRAI